MDTLKPGQPTDNIPHNTKFNPRQATAYGPGVTLFTRNGRHTGNAIIVKEIQATTERFQQELSKRNERIWLVQTDFGNRMKLTDSEIGKMFMLGYERDYDEWWDDRLELIKVTVDD